MIDIVNRIISAFSLDNQLLIGAIGLWALSTITYLARNIPVRVYGLMNRYFTTELVVSSNNISFHNLTKWLEDEGYSIKFRRSQLRNGVWGDSLTNKSLGVGAHLIWYKKRPVILHLEQLETLGDKEKERITIKKFGMSHKLLDEIIKDSQASARDNTKTQIYKYLGFWRHMNCQPIRKLSTVIVSDGKKEILIKSLKKFIESEDWYVNQGIPYHFGVMLYGPPGTGKTSLIKAIAGYLDMDISILPSHKINELDEAMGTLHKGSIAVIEDIDTAHETRKRTKSFASSKPSEVTEESPNSPKKSGDSAEDILSFWTGPGLSLILNAMDGIDSAHGRILIMTTNHLEKIDSALLRPGRIDLCLEVGYMNYQSFVDLVERFFPKHEIPLDCRKLRENNLIAAQVQEDILLGADVHEVIEKHTVQKMKCVVEALL